MNIYNKGSAAIIDCTKPQADVLMGLIYLQFVQFGSNEIVLNPERNKRLCDCIGISKATLYKSIKALKNKELILTANSRIYFNPLYLYYGSESERERLISRGIDYKNQ